MAFSYPLMLDVSARPIVIVGGGSVALRKAKGLLEARATKITVVAPMIHAEMPAAVNRINDRYSESHLEGAGLVFAATDDRAVNDAVVRDCAARNILVCRADRDDELPGDFATPAAVRNGSVTVTVSADSPALSASIRDGISQRWDDRWTKMAELMRELRPRIVADPRFSPAQRQRIFRWLASEEALDLAERGGGDAVLKWLADGKLEDLEDA